MRKYNILHYKWVKKYINIVIYNSSKYILLNYSELENIRKSKKVSREELAIGVGISISTYKKNLANKNMTIAVLERIADFLKVPVISFFVDSDEDTSKHKEYSTNDSKPIVTEPTLAIASLERALETQIELSDARKVIIDIQKKELEMLEKQLSSANRLLIHHQIKKPENLWLVPKSQYSIVKAKWSPRQFQAMTAVLL